MQNRPLFALPSDDAIEAAAASNLRAELHDPAATVAFMLAGNAHVTFQSKRTETRFTYRVCRAKKALPGSLGEPPHFVFVLTGPDTYSYLGTIHDGRRYNHGQKSRIERYAPSATAFAWVWRHLSEGRMHHELGVWHEGRCSRCGRRLTTPRSLAIGLGPTCEEAQA